ncbi:hypothetical protein Tco_0333494, partial [Tanacetum coccineum]
YENEIRQELRWLKAKYQMELRELRDKQPKEHTRHKSASSLREQHKDDAERLLKSFASGTRFVSFSLDDGETQPLHRATSLPVDAIDS